MSDPTNPEESNMQSNNTSKFKQQYFFSITFIIISLIFWIWAIINTIQNSFDAGVISFLTVLITHSIILVSRWKQRGTRRTSTSSKCASWSIVGSHLLVTLNYLGGIYAAVATDLIEPPSKRAGFAIYCGVAAVIWFFSAIVGCRLFSA